MCVRPSANSATRCLNRFKKELLILSLACEEHMPSALDSTRKVIESSLITARKPSSTAKYNVNNHYLLLKTYIT